MRFPAVAIFLSSLPLLVLSVPCATEEIRVDYDAIIVGGGPSGLSALSGLARVRRKALLIDSGEYRNGPTRHMHDVIGFDGVTPAYYRFTARKLISYYPTVTMTNGTVTKIEPMQNNTYFKVTGDYLGKNATVMTARKIVLGTGLRDLLPATPGVRENFGKGLYWCPWCDGFEHADQKLGLLAPLEKIPHLLQEILTLNTDVIAFVNGTDTPEARAATEKENPKWQEYLQLHNVTVENRIITAIERLAEGTTGNEDPSLPSNPEHDVFRVTFEVGEPTIRNAFLTGFKSEQKSNIGSDMGVTLYDGRLAANMSNGLLTNIPGVYAVGDANSDNSTNVPHALYTGKRSAVSIHLQLERENAAKELENLPQDTAAVKRSQDEEFRSVWNIMNGRSTDLLYAGELDP